MYARSEGAIPLVAEAVRGGSLKALTGELALSRAGGAGAWGLGWLTMYEGGNHAVGLGRR
ncbi:MAG: hypothetical protein R3D85_13175 [Paracoccaceae bacterium]